MLLPLSPTPKHDHAPGTATAIYTALTDAAANPTGRDQKMGSLRTANLKHNRAFAFAVKATKEANTAIVAPAKAKKAKAA